LRAASGAGNGGLTQTTEFSMHCDHLANFVAHHFFNLKESRRVIGDLKSRGFTGVFRNFYPLVFPAGVFRLK
jgi:hypothetical protein